MEATNIETFFESMVECYTKEIEYGAIWLKRPIKIAVGPVVRIRAGMSVRVDNNQLSDITPDTPATHKIVGCYGTIASTMMYVSLFKLDTREPLILKIK